MQIAAALLLCAAAGPLLSRAQASCGDYLMDHVDPSSDHSLPLPCQGPHCGRAPSQPVAPVPPTQSQAPDRDLALVQDASITFESTISVLGANVSLLRPQHLAHGQFRPPRFS